MKKIIILCFCALNICIVPAFAWDHTGQEDDPFELDEFVFSVPVVYPFTHWYPDYNNWDDNKNNDGDDDGVGGPGWTGGSAGGKGGITSQGNGSAEGYVPATKNSLPTSAKEILKDKWQEMINNYCAYKAMYDNSSDEFSDVIIDPTNDAQGSYNPCTNKLIFKNGTSQAINETFPEEYIHFFQNNYYVGGICQYLGRGQHYNIEFEAKVIQDLINQYGMMNGYNLGVTPYGRGQNLGNTYEDWLWNLTNGGTSMPTSAQILQYFESGYSYWDFMNDWAAKNGYQVDSNFTPQAFNIFNDCQ
jgi:hypothetical protein